MAQKNRCDIHDPKSNSVCLLAVFLDCEDELIEQVVKGCPEKIALTLIKAVLQESQDIPNVNQTEGQC